MCLGLILHTVAALIRFGSAGFGPLYCNVHLKQIFRDIKISAFDMAPVAGRGNLRRAKAIKPMLHGPKTKRVCVCGGGCVCMCVSVCVCVCVCVCV